jgi:hypothetical protein
MKSFEHPRQAVLYPVIKVTTAQRLLCILYSGGMMHIILIEHNDEGHIYEKYNQD